MSFDRAVKIISTYLDRSEVINIFISHFLIVFDF